MAYKLIDEKTKRPVYIRGQQVFAQDCVNCGSELKDFNEKERSFLAVASRGTKDRMGDIITCTEESWMLKDFRKNPICPFAHRYDQLPVGRSLEEFVKGDKLYFRPQFHSSTREADATYSLYRDGFLRGWSVGFIGLKSEKIKPSDDDDQERGLLHEPTRFLRQSLLEISAVPVPAHADCLSELKSVVNRGLLSIPEQYLSDDEDDWHCHNGICVPKNAMPLELSLPNADADGEGGDIFLLDDERVLSLEYENGMREQLTGQQLKEMIGKTVRHSLGMLS